MSDTGNIFERSATNGITYDADARTVELSFSSELPVRRFDYYEVLSHAPEHVDLALLNNAHPLLLNHDTDKVIGVIERAWIGEDRRGHAVVRFSKSPLAEEIWRDVLDGIRRLVSVRYRVTREVSRQANGPDGLDTVAVAWQPREISIVSIPADASVGVGRSEPIESHAEVARPVATPERFEVMTETKTETKPVKLTEYIEIAKRFLSTVPDAMERAAAAADAGKSANVFAREMLDAVPALRFTSQPGYTEKDLAPYSLSRALTGLATRKLDGLEREVSDEFALNTGRSTSGVWVPNAVLMRSHVAGTNSLGGHIVNKVVAGNEFIEFLRARTVIAQLGARTVNLNSVTTIPRQTAEGTVYWVAETVVSTLTNMTFDQITLAPKCVTGVQQYSRELLATSNPSIDRLVEDDLMAKIALAIDRAAFHGDGGGEPTGIAATAGVGSVALGPNGAALTSANAWPAFVSLESAVAAQNADVANMAYVINAATRGKLKTIGKTGTDSVFVMSEDGTVNGYQTAVTNQLATNLTKGTASGICTAAFFGNFADIIVAEFGSGTEIVIDEATLATNRVVRYLAHKYCDIGIRHPQSFAAILDIIN